MYLMGSPGQFQAGGDSAVVNLAQHGLTFRQSAAFLESCDCFFGPDSSLLHAAGALDVPAVGVFGAYPWKLRTAYYTSVVAIQGIDGCSLAPCFHQDHSWTGTFPANGPCMQTGQCSVLVSIDPKRVIAKIKQAARPPR